MRSPATVYRFVAADEPHIERTDVAGAQPQRIDARTDLHEHATGLGWGDSSAETAQAALAVMADFLEDDARAVELHQGFKFDHLSTSTAPVEIDGMTIVEWIDRREE